MRAFEAEDVVDVVSVRLLDRQRATLDGSPAGYVKVAKLLDVMVILRGKVKSSAEGAHVTLTLFSGHDGRAIGSLSFGAATPAQLRTLLHKELWAAIKPLLAAAREHEAASRREPLAVKLAPQSDKTAQAEPEPRSKSGPPSPPKRCGVLRFEVLGGAQTRTYDYVNEQRGAMRAYRSQPTPLARGEVSWYPLASASCDVSGGLALGYDRVLRIHSELAGRVLPSQGLGGHAELVLRIAAGPLTLEPGLGYSLRHFTIGGGFLPDADFHALWGRVNAELRFAWFLLELHGGGGLVLAAGELQSALWFPGAHGCGYDAEARLGVAPTPWLDVLLAGQLQHYRFDLNATGAGNFPNGLADGAYDRYLDAALGVRLRL